MQKAQHTPAPWRIVTDGINHWIEIEPNKIALIQAKKADRDIIAAAPELLETLEAILATKINPEDQSPWLVKARAAIAKAKGNA